MKRIFLILSVVLATSTAFGQLPTTNLLAWYPFCADTTDHSGNGYNLLVTNSTTSVPALTADQFGNPNTAYRFNGVNSAMHYSSFFSAGGDFSYSCWVKAFSRQSSLIIYNGTVTTNGFGLVMNNGTIGSPGDSVSLLFGGIGLQISAPITLNAWHQVAFTRTGNSYSLYVDAVLIGSISNYFYPLSTPNVFNVGYDYTTNSNAFYGDIDDIAVYSKALSLSEITSLFNFNPDVVPFSLGNDTAICTNTIVLSPSANTPGANYSWSGGGTNVTDTVTPPVFPGQKYWLTISVPYGCTASDTIKVRHITTTVNLGPDKTICAGVPLVLNTPRPGETYVWSTGDTTGTLSVTSTGIYWLSVDSLGCMGSDTINVAVNPHPIVNLGPDTASCAGNPVTLQSSAVYSASVTYVWGAVPVLAAPATTPTFVASVTGTYWVTVTDYGCPWADTIRVTIVSDTFHFFEPADTSICQGATVATNVTINPNITYQWRPTTGMPTSNIADPTISTTVSATYVLTATYTVTPGFPSCPVIIDSFHLDVQPNPVVGYLGQPRSVCTNDTVHITANVEPSYNGYIYSWSPSISLDASTTSTVIFTAGDSTNLILTVSTSAGCTGKDSIQINVHQIGFDSLINPTNPICPGDSVQLNVYLRQGTFYQGLTATYQWTPTIYLVNPTSSSPWAHPITSQNYMVVGTSQYGCFDTLFASVTVRPAAEIYMIDSTIIYPGGSFQISPQTNCSYFAWSPQIGLSDTTIVDPLATPAASTTYIVRGTTEWGCTTTDSIRIHVAPNTLIGIPNAFTPGANINNYLKILKNGLASLDYFRIYNRWGNLLYSTTDIDAGWDGTYKGKPQPFDVYMYELEVVTTTGKVLQQQGNVTLIR